MRLQNKFLSNHWWVIISLLLIVPGCVKQTSVKTNHHKALPQIPQNESPDHLLIENELIDVPVLFGSRLIDYTIDEDKKSVSAVYKTGADTSSIIQFFLKQMDMNGWIYVSSIDKIKPLLLFQKPKKYCIISIQPTDQKSVSCIYVYILPSDLKKKPLVSLD